MTAHSRALIPLCECLRGALPEKPDWMMLLGLANQTLTTTALMPFVTQFKNQIPDDVSRYVQEMFERNLMRNDRLASQLEETVEAINSCGVCPILLKGSAILAISQRAYSGTKLMSDLDIMVAPAEVELAMHALSRIGYSTHYEATSNEKKWYADLMRPNDVGMVDLHSKLPGPAFFYPSQAEQRQYYKPVRIGRANALVPQTTFHALVMVIHDQFQDSDYWTGHIDLRHLLNVRDLSLSDEGLDWDLLNFLTPNKLARNALDTQLLGLFVLFGVDVPVATRQRLIARLQLKRRLAQARYPILRRALLPLAMLDYSNYRTGLGDWLQEGEKDAIRRRWALPKMKNLKHFMELSRHERVGKI